MFLIVLPSQHPVALFSQPEAQEQGVFRYNHVQKSCWLKRIQKFNITKKICYLLIDNISQKVLSRLYYLRIWGYELY